MFSDEEVREAREIVANPETSHRVRVANLKVLRAHAMERMTAISQRSNGNPTGNDRQAYERVESELNDIDGQLARHERDHVNDPADSPEYVRADDAAPGDEHRRNAPRRNRRDVFLGERRFAEAFDIGRPAQRAAEEFSVGALIQGLAGVRELDPASAEGRALTGAGAGGSLVPSAVAAGILDGVFAASTVHAAGAQAVPMPARSLTLPRIDSPPVPGWHQEGVSDVPEDEPGIGAAVLNAKTIAVRFSPAVELLEDASEQAAEGLRQVMIAAIASAIDKAALMADGTSNDPVGLFNDPDVSHTSLAAALAGDSYAELLSAVFKVRNRNLAPNAAVYSERIAETLASMTDTTGQPLRAPAVVEALDQLSTTAVPTDMGAGTNESAMFVGRWSDLAIGYRPSIGVRVQQARLKGDDLTREFVAYARADVATLRPAAFEIVDGILPQGS